MSNYIYRFSNEHLLAGIAVLKKNDFYQLFENIEIPLKWTELQRIYCVDNFIMKKTSILEIENLNGDGKTHTDEGYEPEYINLTEIVDDNGKKYICSTCADYANFIYDLILFIQNEDFLTVGVKNTKIYKNNNVDWF